MWAFLQKMFCKTDPQKEKEVRQETIFAKIDIEEAYKFVNTAQERRRRLKLNPPADLPADAIQTVDVRKEKNRNSLSKYPVFFLKGTTGQDTIEAFINSNPRGSYHQFLYKWPRRGFPAW